MAQQPKPKIVGVVLHDAITLGRQSFSSVQTDRPKGVSMRLVRHGIAIDFEQTHLLIPMAGAKEVKLDVAAED